MAELVTLGSGELARFLQFGATPANYATATGVSLAIRKERVYSTFQGILLGSGAVSASVTIQGSNDDKTGMGQAIGSRTTNASATLTSGGLFSGFIDPVSSRWVPPVQIGDSISGPNIPAGTTVSAIASASSLTMSANATATGEFANLFQSANWCGTALGVIALSGTNSTSDGFTTAAPWRWIRANLTAISGTGATVQVLMGV